MNLAKKRSLKYLRRVRNEFERLIKSRSITNLTERDEIYRLLTVSDFALSPASDASYRLLKERDRDDLELAKFMMMIQLLLFANRAKQLRCLFPNASSLFPNASGREKKVTARDSPVSPHRPPHFLAVQYALISVGCH